MLLSKPDILMFYSLNVAFYWFHNYLVDIKFSGQDFMNIDNDKSVIRISFIDTITSRTIEIQK